MKARTMLTFRVIILFLFSVYVFGMSARNMVSAASGKTYYVSVAGNNKNNGSKTSPFRTIQKGVSKLKKGDTLLIGKGTYKEEVNLSSKIKGAKDSYITIRNVPGEKAVISGAGKKSPKLLTLDGSSYIKITGLEFADASGQDACAIMVNAGTTHFVISNNRIHDIKVPEPEQENHCANCILLFGDDAKRGITYGVISKNKIFQCETGWSECISVTAHVSNIKVINNTIKNTGNIGIDFSGNYGYCKNPAKDFPRNCLISENKITGCVSAYATSYGIYVDGGQKITIQNNTVTSCSGGIEIGAEKKASLEKYATKEIKITGNQITNNKENGITIGGYKKNLGWVRKVTVTKNICENNGINNAILTLSKCSDITIKNNTFYNKKGNAAIVYSEFSKNYTYNITFAKNKYYNGGTAKHTFFTYLGKDYTAFSSWVKAAGDKDSVYKKKT